LEAWRIAKEWVAHCEERVYRITSGRAHGVAFPVVIFLI